ncbi:MAG: antibiotic biosynthesis monooxygenase [Tateyamaria sp.]|uniref:antibiotic biosynthesis monooxygenase family protein n=1 Tax=Tateyamaria sp. TaxID=1929288 RepID=UPI00329C2B6D
MIAVIFEVWPKDGHREPYMERAASIKHHLADIPGFISVERFESLMEPGKLLSLSFWENEEALAQWRNLPDHRAVQGAGRDIHFDDYRLRVAGVIRDYGMTQREEAPADSQALHDR